MKSNKNSLNSVSLSKYLAQAGVASRRKVVDIIKSKVVTINEIVITEPGYKVQSTDCIKVNNQQVIAQSKLYILLNKPKDCITTLSDEKGRCNVIDVIGKDIKERIYPIGRLDRNTTGVLLLTNDGELAQRLSHPSFKIEKIYYVRLNKVFTRADMQKIREGILLDDGFINVDEIEYVQGESKYSVVVALHSGKNRIVRRIFEFMGYEIKKLDRVEYAGITKSGLKAGQWRYLSNEEIQYLKKL